MELKISKRANSTLVVFEIDHKHVAQLHCSATLDRVSKKPVLSEWTVQIQAESFSIEATQTFNIYQNRIAFINQFCRVLKTKYLNDADGFIDLVLDQSEQF
jgi:hypothetical protein